MPARTAIEIAEDIGTETQSKVFLVLISAEGVDLAGNIEPEELGSILLALLKQIGYKVAVVQDTSRRSPTEN